MLRLCLFLSLSLSLLLIACGGSPLDYSESDLLALRQNTGQWSGTGVDYRTGLDSTQRRCYVKLSVKSGDSEWDEIDLDFELYDLLANGTQGPFRTSEHHLVRPEGGPELRYAGEVYRVVEKEATADRLHLVIERTDGSLVYQERLDVANESATFESRWGKPVTGLATRYRFELKQ